MSQLTKELLHRDTQSLLKEIAIKFDSQSHYFYFSRFETDPALSFGQLEYIPVDHINDAIHSKGDKMLSLSIVDSQLVRDVLGPPESPVGLGDAIVYFRFPELEPSTRYHFQVGDGGNNFNNNATIVLPCGRFPARRLRCEYGFVRFDNSVSSQQDQPELLDINGGFNYRTTYLNVRFKVQTITLE